MPKPPRQVVLNEHDETLAENVAAAIRRAYDGAHKPIAVARRIVSIAVGYRNKGRSAARKRPFNGVCEATGRPLERRDAVLDEMNVEAGYLGEVRWTCPRCNNSGLQTCDEPPGSAAR